MRLAQDCDLAGLVAEHVKLTAAVGANTHLKIGGIVAGMLAGADSIDDLDVLRHGGMDKLFGGVRTPSTLGSFLRGFDRGNVRQLEVVSRRLLVNLAAATPVLRDAGVLAHLDIPGSCHRSPDRSPRCAHPPRARPPPADPPDGGVRRWLT